MRRDIRRHADGDARGTIGEQVRESRRKNDRLFHLAIKVGLKVDRLAIDIAKQLFCEASKASFRISIGRCGIAIDRAKVTLTIHERISK